MRTSKEVRRQVQKLPRSRISFPEHRDDVAKYFFWRALTPVHPFFRELCMPVHTLRKKGRRQHFLLGTLAPGRLVEEFLEHLISLGYRKHKVAWREPEQLVSLRLLQGFRWQYHVRIYKDGEVRGHYEHTPESFPFKHLKRVNMRDCRDDFFAQFGEWLTPLS